MRLGFAKYLTLGVMLLALQSGALGWAQGPEQDNPEFVELPPETLKVIDTGLARLVEAQGDDGCIGEHKAQSHRIATTAITGLALMAGGHLPEQGEYADSVQSCLDYVRSQAAENGFLGGSVSNAPSMYAHGFAMLFLAEIYGEVRDDALQSMLIKAVDLIVQAQGPQGGWRYSLRATDADLSVTVCQVKALRAARNAGIAVPKETIDRALAFVRSCQLPDGSFAYVVGGTDSNLTRVGIGLSTMFYGGSYSGDEVERGAQQLTQRLQRLNRDWTDGYGGYYAAQALFMSGDKRWRKHWPLLRERMVKELQREEPVDLWYQGLLLIGLQVPKRLLPILER